MATYKVPQDVEADDKLIGPFSFRQFIYLIIVAMAGAIAWALGTLFIPLAIIPLPVIIFFGALALPLRKDQPMEIYMAAIVSYFLKPRFRKWEGEGVETLIEISAPKMIEQRRTKDLSQGEASARLSYLANIVDSGGWAIRGVQGPTNSMTTDAYFEAQNAPDILDASTPIAQNFDQMMNASTERAKEEARARMQQASTYSIPAQPVAQPQVQPAAPATAYAQPQPQQYAQANGAQPTSLPQFNPYPTFHQSIIQPLNDTAHQAQSNLDIPTAQPAAAPVATIPQPEPTPVTPEEAKKATSDNKVTADIINLANNSDLSIETIAHEAHRIHKKAEEDSEEVVISLR